MITLVNGKNMITCLYDYAILVSSYNNSKAVNNEL